MTSQQMPSQGDPDPVKGLLLYVPTKVARRAIVRADGRQLQSRNVPLALGRGIGWLHRAWVKLRSVMLVFVWVEGYLHVK